MNTDNVTDDQTVDCGYDVYTKYYNHQGAEDTTNNSTEPKTGGAPDPSFPNYNSFRFTPDNSNSHDIFGWDDEFDETTISQRSLAPMSLPSSYLHLSNGVTADNGDTLTTTPLYPTTDTVTPALVAPKLNDLFALQRTHFRSTEPLDQIATALRTVLEDILDAVLMFNTMQYVFNCSIQTSYGNIQVRVNVFRDNDEHIIEVQKICGSSISFYWVWRRLLTHSKIQNLQTVPLVPASALAEPAMNVLLEVDKNLDPIMQMVNSVYNDVTREGLTTLCRITDSSENALLLLRSNYLTGVVNHLQAGCIDCRICATRIVTRVSKADYSSRNPALGQAIRPLIAAMNLATTNVEVAELQRQSCIALRELANGTFPLEIFEQGGATALSRHQESDIAVLAREAQRAVSAIRTQSS